MEIRVMTYNIHHGKGTDKQVNLERIAEVIKNCRADIVGLNEVDKHFSLRSDFEDQIDLLAKKLDMHHAFSPSLSLKPKKSMKVRQYGNALLSRFPINKVHCHHFNFISGLIEGRSLLYSNIQIESQSLDLYVTHLSLNPFLHRMQTDFIAKTMNKQKAKTIVMGDFNMIPPSKGWRKLTNILYDVWTVAGDGKGHTHPSLNPRLRLDYIFTNSPEIIIKKAEVIQSACEASDHLPLMAHIELT
ncbi:endonuclease/exonuclease/phosphatase family protein [Bacillus shivajii]|uniref:endonuclease/exonuclease/phosphatase family protein n=1 Tax=Bacillus shivajii TaxID=1983719 RepID=UPI001CFB8855|nr:endonuclease/exonuclease/phosphatase family protein [Bacillus shivajii]UCZ51545.1 endonuclease/exonuclease/phosphatase family protein [Bacillus shivajii]